jgi:hypothetical protein
VLVNGFALLKLLCGPKKDLGPYLERPFGGATAVLYNTAVGII